MQFFLWQRDSQLAWTYKLCITRYSWTVQGLFQLRRKAEHNVMRPLGRKTRPPKDSQVAGGTDFL